MSIKNIAIFGFKDALVGQFLNLLSKKVKKNLKCIILKKKNKNDLNNNAKKTDFSSKKEIIQKNKIYNLPIFYTKNFVEILKVKNIKSVYILEDDKFLRSKIYFEIKKKLKKIKILNFISNKSYLAGKNKVGEGTIIFPFNYISYKTEIGNCTIIQSGCIIEHHNHIGNFCNVNPRLTTGGFTRIEDFCEIKMSVDIINKLIIKERTTIGAGSLVLKNTVPSSLYFGRPAKYQIDKN